MRIILLVFVIFIFQSNNEKLLGQVDYSKLLTQEKVSLSVGFGSEFGGLGVRVNYLFSDRFAVSAGLSTYYFLVNHLPELSLEYRAKPILNNRLQPYAIVQYGTNYMLSLSKFPERNNFGDFEKEYYLGPKLGLGTKFKLFKSIRTYGNVSVQYTHVNKSKVNEAVSDFNIAYGTDHVRELNNMSISLGVSYIIKSDDPEYKR